jgi:hypothetical protein
MYMIMRVFKRHCFRVKWTLVYIWRFKSKKIEIGRSVCIFCNSSEMVSSVIIATTSDVKKTAFETSAIAEYLRRIGVEYKFVEAGDSCGEFAGPRFPQPFTTPGGIFAALQRVSAIRGANNRNEEQIIRQHYDDIKHYDESGALIGNEVIKTPVARDDVVVIAIESYITENAKDCVCVVVNYYDADGKKREFIGFSPAAYIASFPDGYLQHLATIDKYAGGAKGFSRTIGQVIALNKAGQQVDTKNWHKLYNPFDRVEQIRGTLNYIADEFEKIVVG